MTDYVRLYDLETKTERRDNEETLDFLIIMMNKAEETTISSNAFKDEIIAYCNRFNDKRYLFLTNNELLEQIYKSYCFKRNVMNIINLYVNDFITFEDVTKGITIKNKVCKEKHNYSKVVNLEKQLTLEIQNIILSNKYNSKYYLSNYGFIIENENDITYINNLINAYNSGLIHLNNNDAEMNHYEKFSKITIV
jgi:hypothetical protein